jgi:hypothetical protein
VVRKGYGRLLAVLVLLVSGAAACQRVDWSPDPVSKPSEVTGRVWFCTPGSVDGTPGHDKPAASAVRLEIVSGADAPAVVHGRFPLGTLLGQATVRPGEVWPTGSVHTLPIVWLVPDVRRSDLEGSTRVRIVRTTADNTEGALPWELSFSLSLDVLTVDDTGRLGIDWHLAVFSTPLVVGGGGRTLLDTAFSDLMGWPRPCPPG